MGTCARCDKMFEEYDLMWIEVPDEHDIQIMWTGRGRDKSKEKKMEVVCADCLKKITELDI